jgi:hypothetical protein
MAYHQGIHNAYTQRAELLRQKESRKKDHAPALARAPWALAPLPAVVMRWGTTW